jgi:ABC-type glycerol-3-phosphate transport system permease component
MLPTSKSLKLRKFIDQNLVWLPLLILVIWTVLPLLWSLSSTFKTPLEVYESPPRLLGRNPSLESYRDVVQWPGFWRYSFNSLFLAITSTILAVLLSSFAAYGFARYAFRLRNFLLILILVPRILPRVSLIVPLYLIIERVGLLDTYAALIITYAATAIPLATWILVGFFAGVPKELEEAAAIDGASLAQRLWYIVLPIAFPGMLTVSIFSLREAWNEFPFVLAFTSSSELRTLPYQLFLLRDSIGIENWPLINAFALMTILPIIILYIAFERRVVAGLTSGALK